MSQRVNLPPKTGRQFSISSRGISSRLRSWASHSAMVVGLGGGEEGEGVGGGDVVEAVAKGGETELQGVDGVDGGGLGGLGEGVGDDADPSMSNLLVRWLTRRAARLNHDVRAESGRT